MPLGGAGGQNRGHLKEVLNFFFLFCELLLETLEQTTVIHMTQTIMFWGEGQGDLYLVVSDFA